ncbi:MAG: TetR/AcrR family transcriptional regulator [Propionibacteriaceae bacterium]
MPPVIRRHRPRCLCRTAGHEQRRRQVADALLRVVSSEGLDAASIPRVAREAWVSTGLVQRYFATKDDLLGFAFDHLGRLVGDRIDAARAGVDPAARVGDQLYAALATFLRPPPSSPATPKVASGWGSWPERRSSRACWPATSRAAT